MPRERFLPAFDALAKLFEYPQGDPVAEVQTAIVELASLDPRLAEPLVALRRALQEDEPADRLYRAQERFVRTFELNPVCALEVGWQLYGEQYARGTFLVRMRELVRDTGLTEGTELPDHLSMVLRVIPRAAEPRATKLARRFTLTALQGMREKLGEKAGDQADPQVGLLESAARLIEAAFPATETADDEALPVAFRPAAGSSGPAIPAGYRHPAIPGLGKANAQFGLTPERGSRK